MWKYHLKTFNFFVCGGRLGSRLLPGAIVTKGGSPTSSVPFRYCRALRSNTGHQMHNGEVGSTLHCPTQTDGEIVCGCSKIPKLEYGGKLCCQLTFTFLLPLFYFQKLAEIQKLQHLSSNVRSEWGKVLGGIKLTCHTWDPWWWSVLVLKGSVSSMALSPQVKACHWGSVQYSIQSLYSHSSDVN